MTELVVFADPLAVTLEALRGSPALTGVTFGTIAPATLAEDFPGLPYVWVEVAGTGDGSHYPFRQRVALRMIAAGGSAASSLDLAQRCRAALCASEGTAQVGGWRASSGPVPVTVDGVDRPAARVEVVADMRPAALQ